MIDTILKKFEEEANMIKERREVLLKAMKLIVDCTENEKQQQKLLDIMKKIN